MFFLPEEGRAYTYPFLFDKLNIQARYIGLRVVGATNLVCSDQLAVIKGDASGANRKLQQFPRYGFRHDRGSMLLLISRCWRFPRTSSPRIGSSSPICDQRSNAIRR